MDEARCAQISPETFFPASRTDYPKAIRFCNECNVKLKCLAFALAAEKERDGSKRTGIFGGMTPVERERLQEVLDRMMEKENG
jgi:WhiB family redox-sensing transcriptional regulator